MRSMMIALLAVTGAPVLLSGCGRAEAGRAATPAQVRVTAMNYAFRAPDTMVAGLVRLRMDNAGTELHHTQVIRLDSGKTFQDLAEALRGGWRQLPGWARHVGGPGAVIPGDSSEVLMNLAPGSYALVCYVPDEHGVEHYALGMMRPVVVIAGEQQPAAAAPAADVVMVLDDYRFDLSGALRAGRQTIEVTNAASQFHEVVFMRMEPGKTALDFARWEANRQGPPPGRPIGGPVGLDQGERNWFTVDLAPGNYSLICFYPDRADNRPHFAHGMTRDFVIE